MPPFLLTLLSQGLGILGNAVISKGKDYVEEKLGVDLAAMTQTPEGLFKLKQLEIEHEQFLITAALQGRELELKDKTLDTDNVKNARDNNAKIQESPNASWLAKNAIYLIAFLVIGGGGCMVALSQEADVRMAAVSAITLVLGFFFGTTQSSSRKDSTIANLTQGGAK